MLRQHFDRQLRELHEQTLAIGWRAHRMLPIVFEAGASGDPEQISIVRSERRAITAAAAAIDEQGLVMISLQQPVARDLRRITTARAVAQELARFAEHAHDVVKVGRRLRRTVPMEPTPCLDLPASHLPAMLVVALDAYERGDPVLAAQGWEMDNRLDTWYEQFCQACRQQGGQMPNAIEAMLAWLTLAHDLERMGDRLTNICERVVFQITGMPAYVHVRPATAPDSENQATA